MLFIDFGAFQNIEYDLYSIKGFVDLVIHLILISLVVIHCISIHLNSNLNNQICFLEGVGVGESFNPVNVWLIYVSIRKRLFDRLL